MVFYVNGTMWHVIYCNPLSDNLRRSDGSITLGVTDNATKCVYISNRLPNQQHERVLCHELTHVICFEYDIQLPIDTEEWLCDFMSLHGKEIIYLLDDLLGVLQKKA